MKIDKLRIYPLVDELVNAFAGFLKEKIEYFNSTQEYTTICLSGGNTPKKLFEVLLEKYSDDLPWSSLHFFWGDERCVPEESAESNYGEARRILFDVIKIPDKNLHPIIGDNNPGEEIHRYQDEIKQFVELNNNIPRFDIMILGMGDDGHTASIFPGMNELLASNDICATSYHPVSHQQRITLTGNVLNNSKIICFLISGKSKAQILKSVIHAHPKAEEYPVNYICPVNGELLFFIDNNAASELTIE